MEWITRERPKIDRIACPWLILRFIDAQAVFHYVPAGQVLKVAKQTGAIPYDIPGVALTPAGKNRRIVSVSDIYFQGFGPGIGKAARDLMLKFFPELHCLFNISS